MATIDVGPVRGMRNVEGKLFVVAAQTLYQISNTGVAIPYGTVPGVGRVSMAHNQRGLGNELAIDNGSARYILNTNTLVFGKVTDEGFPGSFMAFFVDGYLGFIEPQGRFWGHSELADAYNYNTLDRYEAEGDPDRIVTGIVSHREVLIMGAETTEPYVNTGGQTGTFERASNTVIQCGCSAKFSPCLLDNTVFWLDDKRIVRRLDGYTPIRVSTDAIDSAFSECSQAEIAQAYAFTWEERGHKVYYITVPGRFTFGYDVLTRQWHRRATWGLPHWDVVDCVFWNGAWIVGSGRNGRLYQLDFNYKLDACDPLVRKRTTGKLWDDENEMTLNNLELKFQTGGPVSVCVPFPAQPEAPSISGDPPGGQKCVAYTFSFTLSGGAAPYVVTLRSGALPAGLTMSNQGVISGTPTESGEFTVTVRVADSNGLYSDITRSFAVAAVSWDYVTWDGPYAQVFTNPGAPVAREPDELIVSVPDSSGVGGRYRSTDGGQTFTNLGSGWYLGAAVNPETLRTVFARTPGVMEWSDDGGVTVTSSGGGPISVNRLSFENGGFYAVGGGRYSFGGENGESWVEGAFDVVASVFFHWSSLLGKWVRLSAGPPSAVQTADDLLNGPWTTIATIPTTGLNQLGGFNIIRDVFYASTQGGEIWRSTDAVNWTLVHTLLGTNKGDISLLPDVGPTGSLVSFGSGASYISVSQDNGETWTDYAAPFSGGYGVYIEGTHKYVNVRHLTTSVARIIDACEVEP